MLAHLRQSAQRMASVSQQVSRAMATKTSATELSRINDENLSVTTLPGQAFVGDLRSTWALSVGEGINTHTGKWLQADKTSPMEYIQRSEPIKVHGLVVASHGVDDPALGCPVEYIDLRGSTRESPAVCKYTGNKYYSDDWIGGGAH